MKVACSGLRIEIVPKYKVGSLVGTKGMCLIKLGNLVLQGICLLYAQILKYLASKIIIFIIYRVGFYIFNTLHMVKYKG